MTVPLVAPVPAHVWAVMPSYDDAPKRSLVEELLDQVGGLTIVDDGSNPRVARELQRIAAASEVELVRHRKRRGKGCSAPHRHRGGTGAAT